MDSRLYLKENNIKITKGRVCILDILNTITEPKSADFIYEECKKSLKGIDLSTVYRTLETLFEKGIIDKFDFGDGKYKYVIKENSHKHILRCEHCKKEVEIDCPMQKLQEIIKSQTGFTLMEHDFDLKGLCNECQKKEKQK